MAKKDKTAKLPKKVAGVKLPKELRKSAGVVVELAQNPVAREILSAALVAGVAAIAKRKMPAARSPASGSNPPVEVDKLVAQGRDLGNILAQGATAFFDTLLKPSDAAGRPGANEASRAPHEDGSAPKGRKRSEAKTGTGAKPRAKAHQ